MADGDTNLGVLPIGYGDGWRRGLSNNAEVLIGGHRHPLVGNVSMDSVTVDLGPEGEPEQLRGERAILIGIQGSERITAEEVARRLETINYEITLRADSARAACLPSRRRRHSTQSAGEASTNGGRRGGMSAGLDVARTALAGTRAWLVGGAVRDRLLGRETADLDVVVDGDPGAGCAGRSRAQHAGEPRALPSRRTSARGG